MLLTIAACLFVVSLINFCVQSSQFGPVEGPAMIYLLAASVFALAASVFALAGLISWLF